MKTQTIVASFIAWWMLANVAYSQGMCIPSALKVRLLQGRVLWKNDLRPMAGMDVELLSFDQSMTRLTRAKTDGSGAFSIARVEPGKYWLRVKNTQIPGLTVEIHLEGKATPRGAKQDYIQFLLSLDPQKYCWGSSVSIVREDHGSPK
jgi:hypothetical protein